MPGWFQTLGRHFPVRFMALLASGVSPLRFLRAWIRPELRHYFIEGDHQVARFSRPPCERVDPRDGPAIGHEWMSPSMAPTTLEGHDFGVLIGAAHSCLHPYRASVFNVSAISVEALSANTILALDGGDLIWEIGAGYVGCSDEQGRFDPVRFTHQAGEPRIKMIEIRLGQGARPGQDGVSPAAHSAFGNPIELMLFIERLRRLSGGKPVGIALCVGQPWAWCAPAAGRRRPR
jgi:hypothetical protein